MRRLTRKAWFGPKRYFGWGLTVSAWQGVVVTLVAVALIVASVLLLDPLPAGLLAAGCILIAYVAVAMVTGDPPGGPKHSA